MLSSIHPLGERGRNNGFGTIAMIYVVASMMGGALVGTALGVVGSVAFNAATPSSAAVAGAVVAVCLAGLAFDLGLGGLSLPSWHRQVNEDWLSTYRGWVYASGFGFQLGMGLVTIVTSALVYVTFALALLSGSVVGGLVVGVAFGLARGLTIFAVARVHEADQLRQTHRRLQAAAPAMRRVATSTLAVAAATATLFLVPGGLS
jgi:hypothetical protein